MDKGIMTLKIYKCKGKIDGKSCRNEYASSRDPNAKNTHDRPQCQVCGQRVNT